MKTVSLATSCAIALVLVCAKGTFPQVPDTPARPVTDTYFGKEIVDPYRWLENVKDPEVLAWLKAQNAYTRSQLDQIPVRDQILARIQELDAKTPPVLTSFSLDKRGRAYYLSSASGVPKGYVRDVRTGIERLLIDPARFAEPGQASANIAALSPSPDGRYVAFLVRSPNRSRAYIIDTARGEPVGKPVENLLGFTGLDWDRDSKGIYLVKLPPMAADMKPSDVFLGSASYRHIVGSDPSTDQLIVRQGESRGLVLSPTSWPFAFPLPDKRSLAVWIEDGSRTGHALYVAAKDEILAGKGTWRKMADFDDGATHAVFKGSEAFLIVPRGVKGRPGILRARVSDQEVKTAEQLILPDPDSIVTDVQAASDALYVTAAAGFSRTFYRITDGGKAVKVEPPVEGAVESFSVDPAHPGGFFKIVGWTRPAEIYRFDPGRGWLRTGLQPRPDAAGKLDLTVEFVNVRSHDGVEIPLTIIYRRGLKRDSSNPALMIGYGSYAASLDPYFDNVFVPWYEAGGILAFAHVRGGGELGEEWHRAGSKEKKPNTWLDFIACAQYLIDQKFTSPARLAGGGTSAGGILIGRSITERPDLFAAALINVATTDMLRAEYQMNGPANVVEFGTVKEKTSFDQLLEMSAYHHVRDGVKYPAVLLSTGMRDTNVDVWQAAKMAARLQAAKTGRPVLLRVDPESGHDQWGSTRAQIRELRADQLAFLMWQLDVQNRLR